MNKIIATITLMCLSSLFSLSVKAASVTLIWNPSPGTNVAGYNVYYGVGSRTYTNKVNVGNTTNATISGLVKGVTYFFAVTAYDPNSLESDYSNEISYTVPTIPAAPKNIRFSSMAIPLEKVMTNIEWYQKELALRDTIFETNAEYSEYYKDLQKKLNSLVAQQKEAG